MMLHDDCCSSEFSGFTEVDETEYVNKMSMLKDLEVSDISVSDISGYSSVSESDFAADDENYCINIISLVGNVDKDRLVDKIDQNIGSDGKAITGNGFADHDINDKEGKDRNTDDGLYLADENDLMCNNDDDSYDADYDDDDSVKDKDYDPNEDDFDDDDSEKDDGNTDSNKSRQEMESSLHKGVNFDNGSLVRECDDVVENTDDSEDYIPLSLLVDRLRGPSKNANSTSDSTCDIMREGESMDCENIAPVRGRGRKRVRNEKKWKRNVAKTRRNMGLSYVSSSGKIRSEKLIKPGCSESCKFKCHSKILQEDREHIFHSYWKLGDVNKQRYFLSKHAVQVYKRVRTSNASRRTFSVKYNLPVPSRAVSVRVCKTFFLHTLSISDRVVRTVLSNISNIGVCQEDKRGRHATRPNKTTELSKSFVREHIESYKCVQSHYCRKDTQKCYLDANLNVLQMYANYKAKCIGKNIEPVSQKIYRKIFDSEYNIGFHHPLKDQCDYCVAFKNFSSEDKVKKQAEYDDHIQNKEKARENKDQDKKKTFTESDLAVCCFDLEEVFLTPNSFNSSLYFKRRLNSFNFTIYDFGTKDGFCYIWNEAIGGRGGCEIATCVYNFIELKAKEGKKSFIFYSDNCVSQNKNRFYLSMLWYSLRKFDLKSITHKYLIKGHTQNEADSIHAGIEASVKNIPVYTTPQWAGIIRTARRNQPYIVKEMSVFDFIDFRSVSDLLKNFQTNSDNEKVYWNSLQIIMIDSEHPNMFSYQTSYDSVVKTVELFKRLRAKDVPDPKELPLKPLRTDELPISREKFVDLISLCRSNLIPVIHHPFFLLLPHD